MSASLNNFTKYSSISLISTQILYSFRIREALDLLRIENFDIVEEDSERRESSVSIAAIEAVYSIIRSVVRNEARRNRQESSTISDIH